MSENSQPHSTIQPDEIFRITNPATLKVLADPLRIEILRAFRNPKTVKEVSSKVGMPATKLYYHVNLLEKHKLIQVVGINIETGIVEKQYQVTRDAIKRCFEAGVNFFDTAEIYASGSAETQMGRAFKELGYKREELVISTKLWRVGPGPNDSFLSRKHLLEGIDNSLKRL